jgi:16S rRNA (adenine1518-N6/adenine1519-N6)-dimethyltransferase
MKRLVNPSVTREIVQRHGFHFKKSLGQNFLIDPNILEQIVEAADLSEADGVLEIGPGIGTLTQALAESAGQVVAIEKDGRLLPILRETLASYPNVQIHHADVLETDLHALFEDYFLGKKTSVVANLPYYVTTPIIMKLLEERLPLHHIVVMVQREVAERMTAEPGGKEYGALSVAVQYYTDPRVICRVPRTVFIPQPQVDSVVILLRVREQPRVYVSDPDYFFSVVRASFAQRRKTLLNNLQQNLPNRLPRERITEVLEEIGIDPARRGETLSIQEFARLAEHLRKL